MNPHGCRKRISGGLLLFVLAMAFSSVTGLVFACASDVVYVPYGGVSVTVFVVSLDGVEGPTGVNASRLINGIADASRYHDSIYHDAIGWDLSSEPLTLAQLKVNVTFTIVRDWDTYKKVVETGVGVIVVNAHGETLPVPAGYSKESWPDKIAEAMACRNVTWVHVAGYPLWHCSFQGGSEVDWGVDGFKRLMSHIGKGNVTCSYPNGDIASMSDAASWGLALHNWGTLVDCLGVEYGIALYGPDFRDCLLMVMWGDEEWIASGVTVRFAEVSQNSSYGFYVHVGISKTYGPEGRTDENYFMGFAGAAEAVYFVTVRLAAEAGILKAEGAVAAARSEGRTSGLGSAIQLIGQAKEHYGSDNCRSACDDAHLAVEAASEATKPRTLTAFQAALLALSTGGGVVATVLIIIGKTRNSKKVAPA